MDFFDNTCLSYFDFDHIDPLTKLFNIGIATKQSKSLDDIKKEIPKCRVSCKFCHRKCTKIQFQTGAIVKNKRSKN